MAGKKGCSGRKPHTVLRQHTQQKISETAPEAMRYIAMVVAGGLGTYTRRITRRDGSVISEEVPVEADPVRADLAKFVVNQEIGSPVGKQVVDLTTKGESLNKGSGYVEIPDDRYRDAFIELSKIGIRTINTN